MFKDKSFYIGVLKGVIISVIFSLIAVLMFALVIKWFSFSDAVIKPVNVIIKTLSVFAGVFFSVKGKNGLAKGLITGILSVLIASITFAAIGGGAAGASSIMWEILLGGAVGAISGVLAVNRKVNA